VGYRRSVSAFSIVALVVCASAFCAAYQQPTPGKAPATTPTLEQIVSALEQRQAENHAAARPYSIVREYRLFGSDSAQEPESVVVARVEYVPPERTEYSIVQSSGSSRGVGIVRRVLDSETELHKQPQNFGVNSENYKFTYEGEQNVDGHRCYVLALEPRRKDHRLISGRVFVDDGSYQVRLIQGEPAKSPSWWLKKVQLTMHYGDIGGVWAPVSTQAVADVRWFGKRLFTSREISGTVGTTVAANTRRKIPAVRKRSAGAIPTVVGIDVP